MTDKIAYECDKFIVERFQGRYYLYLKTPAGPISGAALINGQQGLEKYFKGDFHDWYEKTRLKKVEMIKRNRNRLQRELQDLTDLATIWNITEDELCQKN